MNTPYMVDHKTIYSITNMKTKELINADIFIIPNAAVKYPKSTETVTNIDLWKHVIDQYYAVKTSTDIESVDIANEEFVEIWYVTRKEGYDNRFSNWHDHKIDGYNELIEFRPITRYLPKSLFNGHKEGDIITFPLIISGNGLSMSKEYQELCTKFENGEMSGEEFRKSVRELKKSMDSYLEIRTRIKISARLAQNDYRYKMFGPFETALEKVCN